MAMDMSSLDTNPWLSRLRFIVESNMRYLPNLRSNVVLLNTMRISQDAAIYIRTQRPKTHSEQT